MPRDEIKKVPCCPELTNDNNCDELFFTRTLNYPFLFRKEIRLMIQLILGFRLKRCAKGLVLGDPVYSTTLLPGEKVKLVSTDRRTQFTYDSESKLSYRNEQISEENYFMLASQSYFYDLENSQSGTQTTETREKWNFDGSAKAGLDWFGVKASSKASSSHNNSSTLDYLHTQSSHMRSAATQAVQATHMAHSLSIGEVTSRFHAEGQTEDHYESSTREFRNDNNCFAVSYIFYRLNKQQHLSFEIVSIDYTLLSAENQKAFVMFQASDFPDLRKSIIEELKTELKEIGIYDKNGEISRTFRDKFNFTMDFSLPTPGIIVKGCLDGCNTLEEERIRYYKLKNDLLAKQIELLEKSQEYRSCPVGSGETNPE